MYLTKSDFVLGMSCLTKLSYKALGRYPLAGEDDMTKVFIEQGYQVQGLARSMYPKGVLIDTLNEEKAIDLTNDYLQKDEIILFEAAFRVNGCFFRVDILEKKGDSIRIVEVKSKSEDPENFNPYKRDGSFKKKYWELFIDLAFQYANLLKIFREVSPFLMLVNKTSFSTVDDLHLAFEIQDSPIRIIQKFSNLGDPLLFEIGVREYLEELMDETLENIEIMKDVIQSEEVVRTPIRQTCRSCEHRRTGGFKECLNVELGWTEQDFERNTIFDVWFMTKIEDLVEEKRYFFEDLREEDFYNKKGELGKTGRRQWLQVTQVRDNLGEFVNPELFDVMDKWEYPLQFIDFETAVPPLPSRKGLKPFETIAFQYSIHMYHRDGKLSHHDWIDTRSKFPNFDFVRNLRKDLGDTGTIFCYSPHENSVLKTIKDELSRSEEPDKDELIQWIDTIIWDQDSPREMVDQFELVKSYYYHPKMGRSNSIKDVLPAVIGESEFLREKYSKGYNSENYIDAKFLAESNNPYDLLKHEEGIAKGDQAMVAYLRIRGEKEADIDAVEKTLRRYCELDTLAMVMIFEHWNELKKKRDIP